MGKIIFSFCFEFKESDQNIFERRGSAVVVALTLQCIRRTGGGRCQWCVSGVSVVSVGDVNLMMMCLEWNPGKELFFFLPAVVILKNSPLS